MKFLLSILLVALVGATGCRDGGGSPTPASSTTMRPDAATSTVAPQRDAPPTARRPAAPATVADRYGLTLANTMHPTVPAAIAKAGETGAGWIRLTCGWSWVEPQPGRFDWRRCDAVMAAAAAAGFRVLATLTPSSQWSTTAPTNMPPAEREWYPPADYGAFGRWVEAMVRHYPAVDYWEVGNEPDLRPFWPAPPGEYARLLAEAKEAAGRARPGAKIVLGGLSLAANVPIERLIDDAGLVRIAEASVVAPIVEESVKAIVLVFLFLVFRREFDNVLDGIVYGALVGLGFSFVENVLYLAGEGSETGTDGMLQLWLLRAGLFGLNHSMFTAFTGAALGFARSLPGGAVRGLVASLGLGTAMIMHGIHNLLVTAPGILARGANSENVVLAACLGAVVADWGGILLIFVLATISGVREGRIIREQLLEEVWAGRLTPQEYEILASGGKRWSTRWSALGKGGYKRWRQLGRFFDLATNLAFRKHRRTEGNPSHQERNAREIERLRWQIDYHKGLVAGG